MLKKNCVEAAEIMKLKDIIEEPNFATSNQYSPDFKIYFSKW